MSTEGIGIGIGTGAGAGSGAGTGAARVTVETAARTVKNRVATRMIDLWRYLKRFEQGK